MKTRGEKLLHGVPQKVKANGVKLILKKGLLTSGY